MIRALLFWCLLPALAGAGEVRLAVASNMLPAARAMERAFERLTDHDVSIAHGATGRLYTQITRGAPFDIFLSADAARPDRLVSGGRAVARRPYALGRLVLIGTRDLSGAARIAIADPAIAPYGRAALDVLRHAGLDPNTRTLLLAENVAQVAVWVETGNADAGLLAASLAPALRDDIPVTPVPSDAHDPIRQDAVLLNDAPAPRAFWDWMATGQARAILARHGYDLP